MQRAISTLLSVGLVVGLSACGSSGAGSGGNSGGGVTNPTAPTTPSPSPQTATIAATTSLAFDPGSVTVAPGGTVTFAFGAVGHTVVFDAQANAPASITTISANTSIARTFAKAGTFTFHCTVHPGMNGTVVVADQTTGTNTAPPPGYGP
jgi:plastocyanin